LGSNVAVQRGTVPKHLNLFAHAPERRHAEISNDTKEMIHAGTKLGIATNSNALIRKWAPSSQGRILNC